MQRQGTGFDARNTSWDDVRLLLSCVRNGSFRAAAVDLGITSSTVVRRMERFEGTLGVHLFDRLPSGISLTPEGRRLLKAAEQFEISAFEMQRSVESLDVKNRGTVRISIMDGLGTFWVVPRLVAFQRANPMLLIDLRCADECADVLRMEADIAIQFTRPTNPELICSRVGTLHLYPFAARRYLELFGVPSSRAEMLNHRLVDQAAPQLDESAWPRLLGVDSIEDLVSVRTNSSAAHFYAIEKGAGIGGLPTYAKVLGAEVEPVDLGVQHQLDIWMTYHADAKKVQRISTVIDWVRGCFDPKRFPWFGDDFIHPNDFEGCNKGAWVDNVGAGTVIARGI